MDKILEQIEKMSPEEQAQLLGTEFPAELEKEASAELAKSELADALYAYGAYTADREVAETEELSKEASEEFDGAHQEITEVLEAALNESGILDTEDTAELHKEAQAAAGIILQGYSDQIEKLAASKKGGVLKAVQKKLQAAGKVLKKHKGKAAAGGVAAGVGGAYAYKKLHEKKASEITASELAAIVREDSAIDAVVTEGLDKIAAKGKSLGGKVMKHLKGLGEKAEAHGKSALKYMGKHKAPMAGGLAAGAAAGYAAGKKKD